jgi:integrase
LSGLTKRRVDALRPETARDVYAWDDELPGFGVRVKPSGVKTYFVQYRNTAGRSRRVTIGRHGALAPDQARKLARVHLGSVAWGEDPAQAATERRLGATMSELCDRFLREHAEPKKRPSSVYTDRRIIEKHIKPTLGALRVEDVRRVDVGNLHHSLRSTPTQANRVVTVLSKMFNLAERWGLRADYTNPCRHLERFREVARQRFMSAAELAKLGDALAFLERERIEPPEAIAAIRLLILTGARRSEILCLKWPYVDFDRRLLRLPDSKTGAKTIPLNAPALEVLSKLKRRSEWVLPTADGWTPVSLSKPWGRIRVHAGLLDLRVHDLRHSFASVLATEGTSLLVIGRILGHKVPATTARYAHLSDDPVRAAAELAGQRIAAAMMRGPMAEVVPIGMAAR